MRSEPRCQNIRGRIIAARPAPSSELDASNFVLRSPTSNIQPLLNPASSRGYSIELSAMSDGDEFLEHLLSRIPKLTHDNYLEWAPRMQDYLVLARL